MQKLHFHLSILKTSFLANKQFAIVPATSMLAVILHLFVQHGIIYSVELEGTNYKVFFNYNFPFKSLVYVGPTKRKMWRNSSELRKLNVSFALVSTRKGIQPLYEVQRQKLGGILLCKFDFTKL